MIPASHAEKLVTRWIYTLILYPIFLLITFYLVSKLFQLSWNAEEIEVRNILLKVYYLGHSLIFMFAIWFNKYVIPKSFLVILASIIVLAAILCLMGMIVFPELINKNGFGITINEDVNIEATDWFKNFAEHTLFPIAQFVFWWILPPFFWVVGYFKMTEKEA